MPSLFFNTPGNCGEISHVSSPLPVLNYVVLCLTVGVSLFLIAYGHRKRNPSIIARGNLCAAVFSLAPLSIIMYHYLVAAYLYHEKRFLEYLSPKGYAFALASSYGNLSEASLACNCAAIDDDTYYMGDAIIPQAAFVLQAFNLVLFVAWGISWIGWLVKQIYGQILERECSLGHLQFACAYWVFKLFLPLLWSGGFSAFLIVPTYDDCIIGHTFAEIHDRNLYQLYGLPLLLIMVLLLVLCNGYVKRFGRKSVAVFMKILLAVLFWYALSSMWIGMEIRSHEAMDTMAAAAELLFMQLCFSLTLCNIAFRLLKMRGQALIPTTPTGRREGPPPVQIIPLAVGRVSDPEGQCVICLELFGTDCNIVTLPCTHLFHFECINGWLGRQDTCPLCRESLPARVATNVADTINSGPVPPPVLNGQGQNSQHNSNRPPPLVRPLSAWHIADQPSTLEEPGLEQLRRAVRESGAGLPPLPPQEGGAHTTQDPVATELADPAPLPQLPDDRGSPGLPRGDLIHRPDSAEGHEDLMLESHTETTPQRTPRSMEVEPHPSLPEQSMDIEARGGGPSPSTHALSPSAVALRDTPNGVPEGTTPDSKA